MSVPPVPSAPGSETGEGGTNEISRADEANWTDGVTGGESSAQAVSAAADESHDGAEDPRRKAARLRRRRRLLAWGAAPALLVTAVSVWMGFIFLMTIMANRAIVAEDYPTAVSRYGTVAKVDPVLSTWRVHYNLGTARLLADDADGAVTELEEALTTAPKADMVDGQLSDGTTAQIRDPKAPECLVRVNLYSAHLTRAQNASDAGDEAGAQAAKDEATTAAGECPVPPPSDDASDDQSPPPSSEPSDSPSPDPSEDPSSEPSEDPSSDSSDEPSSEPTDSESSASPTPTPGDSSSDSSSNTPSPSPSPTDAQRGKLQDRNDRANGDSGGKSGGNGRKW